MELKGHIWLIHEHRTLLGKGRVAMLKQIRATGSISAAGATLGMAYRKAWRLVDSMNRQSPVPLVIRSVGGKGGGGSRLTAAGIQAICMYEKLEKEWEAFMREKEKEIKKSAERWNI